MAHFRHELKPTGEGYRNRECPTHHKTLEAARECIVRRHGEAYAEGRIFQEQGYNKGETKMEILNLTPHPVNIINGEGVMTATFPVAGPAPRLAELVESLPAVDGLPVNKVSYSEEITNLPAPHKGVLLIVSRITAAAVTSREDILFPHGEVRDENGRILGVRALGRF